MCFRHVFMVYVSGMGACNVFMLCVSVVRVYNMCPLRVLWYVCMVCVHGMLAPLCVHGMRPLCVYGMCVRVVFP